jgi:hypothetical protein
MFPKVSRRCAYDHDRLHREPDFLSKSLIWSLPSQSGVGAVIVVEVFPLP